jgi:hypothetical protein
LIQVKDQEKIVVETMTINYLQDHKLTPLDQEAIVKIMGAEMDQEKDSKKSDRQFYKTTLITTEVLTTE